MCSAVIYRWIWLAVVLGDVMATSVIYDENIANVPNAVIRSKDDLRCHCNLPVCVATGYMCKSAMGMCFSEIVDRSDLSKSRHGCLELLNSDKVEACHNEPGSEAGDSSAVRHLGSQRPLVLCCRDDLCNLSAQQVQLRFNSALRNHNHSSGGLELGTVAIERSYGDVNAGVGHATPKDLWLKAATIAVPIAGGFILVLLVFLAIRMLRRDRENGMDYLPTQRNDFQIPYVWGKSQLQQQQQQQQQQHRHKHYQQHQQLPNGQCNGGNIKWKDRQPMGQSGQAAIQAKIVYLPAVHKISSQKKMWAKKSHIFPNCSTLDHV